MKTAIHDPAKTNIFFFTAVWINSRIFKLKILVIHNVRPGICLDLKTDSFIEFYGRSLSVFVVLSLRLYSFVCVHIDVQWRARARKVNLNASILKLCFGSFGETNEWLLWQMHCCRLRAYLRAYCNVTLILTINAT